MHIGGASIDSGDTAWVLVSAAMVLLMTPGVALFYGGMVRVKTVLNTMMMSVGAMATVGVAWVLWGYGEAFGPSWHGMVGNPFQLLGLSGLLRPDSVVGTIPSLAFAAFQAVFAIITEPSRSFWGSGSGWVPNRCARTTTPW